MTYDELCGSVFEAICAMERCHSTPSEIKLSPEAFNTLCDERYGINYHTLYDRLYRHDWPIEKALNTPVRRSS